MAGRTKVGTVYFLALHKSIDGGKNWTHHKITSKESRAYSIAINPKNDNIIYVSGVYTQDWKSVLFKSSNGGKDWTKIGNNISETIDAIAVDPVSPSKIYLGTYRGVYRSTDSGSSWENPTKYFGVECIKINPNNPKIIFAAGWRGVYYSSDEGNNWIEANRGLTTKHVECLDWDLKKKIMYAGSDGGGVYKNIKLLRKIK